MSRCWLPALLCLLLYPGALAASTITTSSPKSADEPKAYQPIDWRGACFMGIFLVNACSTVVLLIAVNRIFLVKAVSEGIMQSAAQLTTTSVKIGIGPAAKRITEEIGKKDPAFARLLAK